MVIIKDDNRIDSFFRKCPRSLKLSANKYCANYLAHEHSTES